MKKSALLTQFLLASALGLGIQTGALANEASQNKEHSSSATEAVSDTWITTKIKAELASTKDLKSTDISVETNNGMTTLTGTVPSDIEMKKAIAVAESVKGVKSVDSSALKVKE